jgi:gluconokinase
MGVAGAGKTTIGRLLAQILAWPFLEGDDFHSASNLEKMKLGIPLSDRDRLPWLQSIRRKVDELIRQNQPAVIACSALKKTYRRILSDDSDSVRFVYLRGDYKVINNRLKERRGHFMKPDMLASQFETLEEPEEALEVDASQPPEKIIRQIRERLPI